MILKNIVLGYEKKKLTIISTVNTPPLSRHHSAMTALICSKSNFADKDEEEVASITPLKGGLRLLKRTLTW